MSPRGWGVGLLVAALFALLLFFPGAGEAQQNYYKWVDEKGTVHFTDNYYAVPPQYRSQVKEVPVEVPSPPPGQGAAPSEGEKAGPAPGTPSSGGPKESGGPAVKTATLYGNQTEEEWKKSFSDLRQQIQQLQSSLTQKKAYLQALESGRRLGSIYGTQEIGLYDRYKKEVPEEEAKLKDLQAQLEELGRKARYFGVPRSIRGQ